jgi:hypothetical protein
MTPGQNPGQADPRQTCRGAADMVYDAAMGQIILFGRQRSGRIRSGQGPHPHTAVCARTHPIELT